MNDQKKILINVDKLPEECKTLLDVIDVINDSDIKTKDELLVKLESDKTEVKSVLNKHVNKLEFEVVDDLLDNLNRVVKAEELAKKVIE